MTEQKKRDNVFLDDGWLGKAARSALQTTLEKVIESPGLFVDEQTDAKKCLDVVKQDRDERGELETLTDQARIARLKRELNNLTGDDND